ncbi:hypothetical protein Tco_1354680 [Tanacetum coccineum]
MANLEFCDKHNMVAYLKKPTRNEGFQEIVDFLNGIHIRFALIKNPTIYVSLIEKFWQTATVRTVDNGEQKTTATVDGKEFTITKASVRRHLQLADVEEPIPNIVPSSHQKTQTPRQTLNQVTELPQTSKPIPNVAYEVIYKEGDDKVERTTTTAASLDPARASGGSPRGQEAMGGSIAQTRSKRVPTSPSDLPLSRFNTLRSDEGSEEIRETVKSNQPRRRAKIVVLDDEEDLEDSSKQGRMIEEIDQDAGVTLVTPTHSQEDQPEDQLGVLSAAKVLADATKKNVHTYTRKRSVVSIASRLFSTAEESVSIVGASIPVSTAGMVQEVNKDKAAVRLQEQLDEEERQRIAIMYKEAKSFNIKEWENIQAIIEADEEIAQRIQAEEREKYYEAEKARLLVELIKQRKRYFAQQRAEERRNKPLTQAQ